MSLIDIYKTPLNTGLPRWPVVKNPPAGDAGDMGLIPGSGRSPEGEMATHSSILAWEIPWTEEPGGLYAVHGVTKSQYFKYTPCNI